VPFTISLIGPFYFLERFGNKLPKRINNSSSLNKEILTVMVFGGVAAHITCFCLVLYAASIVRLITISHSQYARCEGGQFSVRYSPVRTAKI